MVLAFADDHVKITEEGWASAPHHYRETKDWFTCMN
jgi:hypothetical protein